MLEELAEEEEGECVMGVVCSETEDIEVVVEEGVVVSEPVDFAELLELVLTVFGAPVLLILCCCCFACCSFSSVASMAAASAKAGRKILSSLMGLSHSDR